MTKRERIPPLINYLGFQATWFCVVLNAAAARSELGIAFALVVVTAQLCLLRDWQKELRLVLLVTVLGSCLDAAVMSLGAFSFPVTTGELWPYPLWMSGLWLSFAMTLNHSMSWLKNRYVAAAILGAIGGPLCYIAAESFGAISLLEPRQFAIGAVAAGWTTAMVLITCLQQKLS